MAETNAVFGGEHSGHFYFRDFWRADSGMLAALHAIAALGETKSTLSELLKTFNMKTKTNLPIIRFHEDIIARLLGLIPGSIVKITRPSPSAGFYTIYRVCAP